MANAPDRREQLAALLLRIGENRGDEKAWAGLYDLAWPRAVAIAYRFVRGRRELAEDVGQEVFLRLLRYADTSQLALPEDFYRYLAKMVQNVCRDLIRKERSAETTNIDETDIVENLASGASTYDLIENRELLSRIEDSLTGEDRRLVRLLAEGLKVQEIADRLGLSYSNAGVRIHRIRRQLHKHLIVNGKI